MAPAVGFHGHEHGIDLSQHLRIIQFQYPAFLGSVVLIENAETERLGPVRSTAAPYLKSAGILDLRLLVEVIGIKDERLPFRVENAAIGFLGLTGAGDDVDFCDVAIACSHEFANVTILETQKPYGCVFYTKGKSLIFYANDLDQ